MGLPIVETSNRGVCVLNKFEAWRFVETYTDLHRLCADVCGIVLGI
jgi:hypothetical protein